MHAFTSISTNYLPKARVLATTLKRFHPEAVFHLLLADSLSGIPVADLRVFDNILTLNELPPLNQPAWIFQHGVAELCAAIKGVATQEILRHCGGQNLYFFDPDIAILGPLDGLEGYLSRHSVIVTPHLCVPEEAPEDVLANEICALRHGVFNLGFLGLRPCAAGHQFVDWWAQRLWQLCYDDMPGGVFGDQRWVDLAPAFFPDLGIVRDPEFNVATWNLTQRKATGSAPFDILMNGRPLAFYHFSGIDSGAQEQMLNRYGKESQVLFDLRRWYLAECERLGQAHYAKRPWLYGFYNNGTPITREQRLLYRARPDLQAAYPDPFAVGNANRSYLHWYENSVTAPARAEEQERTAQQARFQAQEALLGDQLAQLQARETEVKRLQEVLATKEAELTDMLATGRQLEVVLATKDAELTDLRTSHNQLQEMLAAIETEVTALQAVQKQLQNLSTAKDTEQAALSTSQAHLQDVLAAKESELASLSASQRQLQDALTHRETELNAMHASRSWRFARTPSAAWKRWRYLQEAAQVGADLR